MLNRIYSWNRSAVFWWGLCLLCLLLEAGALYYQYVLNYLPCVLCVHLRAWVLGILLVAVAALFLRHTAKGLVFANLLALLGALGMLERAYQTLATERGWTMGDCGTMGSSFPLWMPLDQWLPGVFQALEPCGVTPWLVPMWLSMAEGLVWCAGILVVLFLILSVLSVLNRAR